MVDDRQLCNGLDPETRRSDAWSKGRERKWGYWGWAATTASPLATG